MKKLIVVVASCVMAGGLQAASMTWGTGKLYKPESDGGIGTAQARTAVTAYYFKLNAATYTELYNSSYATTAENVFNKYMTVDGTTFDLKSGVNATGSGKTGSSNSSKSFVDTEVYSANGTSYAAMILKYSSSGQDYYIANLASYKFEADADNSNLTMGTYEFADVNGTKISEWTAVEEDTPEPTSGLLLLVGGALLAIRRKRV